MGHVRTARIRAKAHRDPFPERPSGTLDNAAQHKSRIVAVHSPHLCLRSVKKREGNHRRDGRHQRSSLLFKQFHHLVCRHCAVFDRIHAAAKRSKYALGALRMGRHRKSAVVRFLTCRVNDLLRHLQNAWLSLFLRIHDPACDHELDEVRAACRDLADTLHSLLRRSDRISQRSRHMASRHGDPGVACQDPGTRHRLSRSSSAQQRAEAFRRRHTQRDPGHAGSRLTDGICQVITAACVFLHPFPLSPAATLFDLIPEPSVVIGDPSDGSDRSHAAVQRCVGVAPHQRAHAFACDLIGSGEIHQSHIILRLLLLSGRLSSGIEMHVKIDQARHQIAALDIHDLAAGGHQLLCGDNVSDPAVLHNNCLPRLRHHILCAVKYDSANICCLHNLPSKIRLPSRVAGPNCILVIILYYRIYITIPQISSSGDKKSTPGKNRERFGKRLGKRNKAPFRA